MRGFAAAIIISIECLSKVDVINEENQLTDFYDGILMRKGDARKPSLRGTKQPLRRKVAGIPTGAEMLRASQ